MLMTHTGALILPNQGRLKKPRVEIQVYIYLLLVLGSRSSCGRQIHNCCLTPSQPRRSYQCEAAVSSSYMAMMMMLALTMTIIIFGIIVIVISVVVGVLFLWFLFWL